MNPHRLTRRDFVSLAGTAALTSALAPSLLAREEKTAQPFGAVVGDPISAKLGETVLKEGGNAVDAAVTAALASCICSPSKCGIGGYGGHAMIALAHPKIAFAIDFDSIAPAAARPDMFQLDASGRVAGNVNTTGWLAAGVPGTVAGLELMLTRHGTRSLRQALAPAIRLCEEGVHVAAVKGVDDASRNDPRPEAAQAATLPRERQRNAALGRLLKTLASENSSESFYRGDIARTIAAAFQRNGGLVTREDLAAYRPREMQPLTIEWNGSTLSTVPLPATGLLVLQALSTLDMLGWSRLSSEQKLHAKLETLRAAWAERARSFGDLFDIPWQATLAHGHLAARAQRISDAVKTGKPLAQQVDPSRAGGTIHLSAADRHGNLVAVTLTHGGSYGARVAVDELGLILGHGMSRFDPRPGLPNSIGPRKRPLTNMCPTIVSRAGRPILAIGAAGGTRIPNSVFEVLANFVGLNAPLAAAMASPRLHTDGTLNLGLEKTHPPESEAMFKRIGYKVARSASAYVSAVAVDPRSGTASGISSGGA